MADADIKDFLTALSAAGVKFVVVGAYAVASLGHVRATADFDVLVEPSASNATKLERAVREFGIREGAPGRGGPGVVDW